MEIDLAIAIRRPPDVVFAFLADVQDHLSEASRSIVPELDKVTPGPTRVGTRWREVVRVAPGLRMTIWSEAIAVEPAAYLAESFTAAWMRGSLEYRIRPIPDGCELRQRQVVIPRGLFRLAEPLLARIFRARVGARLAGIRTYLEADSARSVGEPVADSSSSSPPPAGV